MRRIHFSWLFVPILSTLCGCQPDTSPRQTADPVVPAQAVANPAPLTPQAATQIVAKQTPDTSPNAVERDLAKKSGCFTCHTIEKKLVGPAWIDVAAKYRGQKDAEVRLVGKVAKGGGGVWGAVPMPPNSPRVSESDIKVLVHFILSLK
jgi:cytochrome c